MRGLTSEEENALRLVHENTTGDTACGGCATEDVDYSIEHAVVDALVTRGLIATTPCRLAPKILHAHVTDLGKLALRCAVAARTLDP